jgi:hypothetical protein
MIIKSYYFKVNTNITATIAPTIKTTANTIKTIFFVLLFTTFSAAIISFSAP